MESIFSNLHFFFFGGKGGVGKTVCSAATGIYLSELGKKTLVYSVDPAHSLTDCFGQKIGNRIVKIEENLYAYEVAPQLLLNDLKVRYGEVVNELFHFLRQGVNLPF